MNIKKLLSIALASIILVGSVGCGNGTDSTTTSPNSDQSNTSEGSGSGELSGKLSIWSWGAGREKEARELAVDVFIEAHPELQIEHVVLPTADSVWDQKSGAAYAAGNAGDVMQMSPDYYGLMTQYFEDLNPYVERDSLDLESVVTDGMLDGYYRPDGKLEALPLLANVFVFAYNKNMFDEANVDYPTDDWTWDDVLEIAPKFAGGEGVNKTYALSYHWVLPNFGIIAKGGVPYSEDFTEALVDSPEVADSLNLFGELIDIGGMPNSVTAENLPGEQMFVSGKAAIYPMGGFEIASVTEAIGDSFEWDAVLPPKSSDDSGNTNMTYATGYAMNEAASNKDAAWQFLKEVSFENDDMATETAVVGIPANRDVADEVYAKTTYGNVANTKYVEALKTSRLNIWGGALAPAGDQYSQMWETVTIAGKTGEEAQEEFFPLVEQAFAELDIKG